MSGRGRSKYPKHLVIPDTQCRPGVDLEHLRWAGRYALQKRPDVIVHLGDHWDMPSLSSWDSGATKAKEDRRYMAELYAENEDSDIGAGNRGLDLFMEAIDKHNRKAPKARKYKPRLVMLRGNHEHRIGRAIEAEPWLAGALGYHHFNDRAHGWEVHEFLQPVVVNGVSYCHFYVRNAHGQVTQSKRGQASARAQVIREQMSATAGHKQGLDVAIVGSGAGMRRGIIAGSFYSHEEDYLTAQGNDHWRGILLKHDVHDGKYDLCEVSLDFLRRRFS